MCVFYLYFIHLNPHFRFECCQIKLGVESRITLELSGKIFFKFDFSLNFLSSLFMFERIPAYYKFTRRFVLCTNYFMNGNFTKY